ncbi:FecR family protein [Pedobacter faecalis]|uniref:FecR family protein n=1 Tax=Pedobacter faecalis TaxID=3041495 RepID=UPI00254C9637|nr:FecR domain-containing protein [Pedobacter sp. ELA7]
MDTKKAQELINRFRQGRLSPEDEAILDGWYLSLPEEERSSISDEQLQARKEAILMRLNESYLNSNKEPRITRLWPRIAVSAAAVAAIIFGLWFFNYRDTSKTSNNTEHNYATDIKPGTFGATITLANGKTIALSEAKEGVVIGNGITYTDGTSVMDSSSRTGQSSSRTEGRDLLDKGSLAALEMTAATARGQTYHITLPDGTKVWLNAASKIEFPGSFDGLVAREVRLSGEAYFEVFRNKKQPFVVNVKKLDDRIAQRVEVLGTHFNINGYADEANIKTTLLEGSVKVMPWAAVPVSLPGLSKQALAMREVLLKPGQQAMLTPNQNLRVAEVNTEEAVAWKNGSFAYNNTPLEEVMRQIARWYNVSVSYEKESLKKVPIGGAVSRNDNVSRMLKTLENTGAVRFEIKGKTILVKE